MNKVYVSPDIVSYCKAAGLDLRSYCVGMERALAGQDVEFVPYDPGNPHHVADVMNGASLISGQGGGLDSLITSTLSNASRDSLTTMHEPPPTDSRPITYDTLANMGIERENRGELPVLKALGIPYDAGLGRDSDDRHFQVKYIGDPLQTTQADVEDDTLTIGQKKKRLFTSLVDLLG